MKNEYNIVKEQLQRLFNIKEEQFTDNNIHGSIKHVDDVIIFPPTLIELTDNNHWVDFVNIITSLDDMSDSTDFVCNIHDLILKLDDLTIKYDA